MRRCIALIVLTIVTAAGCTSTHAPNPAKTSTSAPGATKSCLSSVTPRTLPTWARAGFQPPTTPMPYVIGDRGDIVAILWADHNPLHAPPLATVNNKILWVSKTIPGPFTPLRIRATLDGTNQTVTRQVAGGPGPSIIDLPAAGCWSLSLSWSGHQDHLSLRYAPPRPASWPELTPTSDTLQPLQHRQLRAYGQEANLRFRNIGDGRAPFGNVGQTDHGHAGTKGAERP